MWGLYLGFEWYLRPSWRRSHLDNITTGRRYNIPCSRIPVPLSSIPASFDSVLNQAVQAHQADQDGVNYGTVHGPSEKNLQVDKHTNYK